MITFGRLFRQAEHLHQAKLWFCCHLVAGEALANICGDMEESLLYYALLVPLTLPVAMFFMFWAWMGFQAVINN